ncbi:carbohydrate ABC transporter permease, partial [Streptomyces sp. MBT57]|nr:carbohydrate ABC transporter permease [Streptomyces sp. MBT57]
MTQTAPPPVQQSPAALTERPADPPAERSVRTIV